MSVPPFYSGLRMAMMQDIVTPDPLIAADDILERFSMNTHFDFLTSSYYALRETHVVPAMLDLGLRYFRERMSEDAVVLELNRRLYTDHGIRQLVVMRDGNTAQEDFDLLTANYTPEQVWAVAGYNEPENYEEAAAHITALSALIRADPDWSGTKILTPSYTSQTGFAMGGDLRSVTDFRDIHPYPRGEIAETLTGRSYVAPSAYNPFVVSETGYNTFTSGDSNVDDAAVVRYVNRLILWWLTHPEYDVYRMNLYELLCTDTAATIGTSNATYGMLNSDGSKRPQYWALKAFLNAMADPGDSFTPRDISVSRSYTDRVSMVKAARRDGSYDLLLWNKRNLYDGTTDTGITVADVSEVLTFGIPMASATILRTSDGQTAAWAAVTIAGNTQITVSVDTGVSILRVFPN